MGDCWGGNIAVFFRFQIFLGSYRGQFFTVDILYFLLHPWLLIFS
jgi:hypothetical protein